MSVFVIVSVCVCVCVCACVRACVRARARACVSDGGWGGVGQGGGCVSHVYTY